MRLSTASRPVLIRSRRDKAEEWLIEYLEVHGTSKPGRCDRSGRSGRLYEGHSLPGTRPEGVIRGHREKNFRSPTNRWKLADDEDDDSVDEEY